MTKIFFELPEYENPMLGKRFLDLSPIEKKGSVKNDVHEMARISRPTPTLGPLCVHLMTPTSPTVHSISTPIKAVNIDISFVLI